ncbi:MAG: hypothetical protein AAGH38_06155, partial [Pseudomonadota bacterium]
PSPSRVSPSPVSSEHRGVHPGLDQCVYARETANKKRALRARLNTPSDPYRAEILIHAKHPIGIYFAGE